MLSLGSKLLHWTTVALFPRFCVGCGEEGTLLCRICDAKWQPDPTILPVSEGELEGVWPVWSFMGYADPIARQLITAWKYQYDTSAWQILQRRLHALLVRAHLHAAVQGAEAIAYIPLSATRKCERGFDQAEAIAHWVANGVHLPVVRLLERGHRKGHQADRTHSERAAAMAHSPFRSPLLMKEGLGEVVPNCVVLVDDVWTTGSTMNAAARVLLAAGVKKVVPITLAKG